MANTITNPSWIKSKPHASGEKQVGDSDPLARADVINRPPKGVWAVLQRVINTLLDNATVDGTDPTTVSALSSANVVPGMSLTNKTGGALVKGDVVAIDSSNDESVALNDAASSQRQLVVSLESVSNNAVGRFARTGKVTVNVTGTVTRGNYIVKSVTTKVAADSGTAQGDAVTPPAGTFGIALTADSGGQCTALLLAGW
jgi:hypothetical protein